MRDVGATTISETLKPTCCSCSSWRRRAWGDRSGVARRRCCRGASTPPDSGLKNPPPTAAAAASAVPSAKAPAQQHSVASDPCHAERSAGHGTHATALVIPLWWQRCSAVSTAGIPRGMSLCAPSEATSRSVASRLSAAGWGLLAAMWRRAGLAFISKRR